MENTSFVALSRLTTLRRQLDVIANNIANMNTTAFKGDKMMFVDYLVRSKGGDTPFGEKVAYVRDLATMRDTTEGSFKQTDNPLDMAIHGDGYFAVQTPNGERYTRNGHFTLDATGQLVTETGDPVMSEGGQPFFFAPGDTNITVARDGTISTQNGTLGRLSVVNFTNDQELRQVGGGLYSTTATPTPVQQPDIVQNMLESSNVQPIIEMTQMIDVNRTYQAVQKLIDAEDQRMTKMIRELPAPVAA